MKVFVAGATGAIGKCLVPRLLERGYEVVGTTRSSEKAQQLRASGVEGIVLDGLDRAGVMRAVARARPDVVIDELTALSEAKNLKKLDKEFTLTNRLRTEGLDHLLAAARATGTRRVIAQSFAGLPNIREGGPIKTEADPLDPRPPAGMSQTVAAIRSLESRVTAEGSGFEGLALRYGGLYGPNTSLSEDGIYARMIRKRLFAVIGSGAGVWSFIHVDDAAAATVAAIEHGNPGLYNIVDDEPAPVSEWLPYLAEALGAKPPRHFPVWLGRLLMGDIGVSMMTRVRGSSNVKAKRELDWRPFYASWRDGFRNGLSSHPAESRRTSVLKAA